MKVTLKREPGARKEIVVICDEMDAEVRDVLELLSLRDRRLPVDDGGALRMLEPSEVLYCESVDERTYAYTASGVFRVGQTLAAVAEALAPRGFFRCSKSMAVNLRAIETLKSGVNGRIAATLQNGERILVSRRYAGALRERLKGE
jgi:DNA-binding LytR/AlgR family response regulator